MIWPLGGIFSFIWCLAATSIVTSGIGQLSDSFNTLGLDISMVGVTASANEAQLHFKLIALRATVRWHIHFGLIVHFYRQLCGAAVRPSGEHSNLLRLHATLRQGVAF